MTRIKKRIYLSGLAAVFIIAIPVLILYSSGYRLDSNFRLVRTGGIYLVNDEPDIVVKLDQKEVKKTGLFEKSILIRDLTPRTYAVTVEKNGYRKWRKRITVEAQKVQICYPLLIPVELNSRQIPQYLPDQKTKKNREINSQYSDAMELFGSLEKPAQGVKPKSRKSDTGREMSDAGKKLSRKVLLTRNDNKIVVEWTGLKEKRPFFIDSSGRQPIFFPQKRILSFGFFPGRNDAILVLLENHDLFAVEIDRRFAIHNMYKIVSKCSRFAVNDEFLYYFLGNNLYMIDFDMAMPVTPDRLPRKAAR
jgi:hypothetical protein